MLRIAFAAALAFTLAAPNLAEAHEYKVGTLTIGHPWTRATPKGASIGGGYLKITNTGTTPDRLVGGAATIAQRFEIHEMSMDNGVMKMRALDKGIEVKPGETVEFKPGGYHVMFVNLSKAIEPGEHVKATLEFEKAGKVDVDFIAVKAGQQSPGDGEAGGAMGGMQHSH